MKNRRSFLKIFSLLPLAVGSAEAKVRLPSPLATNRLRPPGAVAEAVFAGTCIRCGRCVEVCPYRSIEPLDIRAGVNAGTPLIYAEKIPCYVCMKCVQVCPTGALQPVAQQDTRMGLAVIDKHSCVAWLDKVLCRTCYNVCPFQNSAIRLEAFKPVIDEKHCTGCGLCTHGCPITVSATLKAVNIQPVSLRKAGETPI